MRPKNLEKEEAIRSIALKIIAEEGLENLSMQKLAAAANVSPRTIYIKYADKEDLLITLFIEDVLGPYEKAVLEGFKPDMKFEEGMKKMWLNTFRYLKNNKHAFALMRYGKASPQLNKAFQQANIKQGDYFAPLHEFQEANIKAGVIKKLHPDILKAMSAPLFELVNEYFDYEDRPKQIITEKVILDCCDAVIKGMLK